MNVSDQEVDFLRKVFKKFDTLNTGYLNTLQFTKLIKTLARQVSGIIIDNTICEAVFAYYDKDNNKRLSFEEIYSWWISRDKFKYFMEPKATLMKKARLLFTRYAISCSTDNNSPNGMIFSEFESLLFDHNKHHDESAFDNIDIDEDGIISFTEFVHWLGWLR